MSEAEHGSVIALAGRRIDAPGADPPRFPLERVSAVRRRLADLLVQEQATALVCSAACGADLAALEAAEQLGCGGVSCCRSRRSGFAEPQ
jgi:hypothetical protein